MSTTLAPPIVSETAQSLVLSSVSWEQYEAILRAFPEQVGLRIIYLDRSMTLLSPSYRHDIVAERLADFVKAVANGLGISWEQAGHATFKQEDQAVGAEGDKTFYFGPHARAMLGESSIDLAKQPPPDLAIEVEHTHPADRAVAVWGRIGVPEVWRLQVAPWTLGFSARTEDGTYAPSKSSLAFPALEPPDVLNQLRLADRLGSSDWCSQLDAWVRNELLPRRNG